MALRRGPPGSLPTPQTLCARHATMRHKQCSLALLLARCPQRRLTGDALA